MTKIITVTLNPTLDRTLFVHHLAEGYTNTVTEQTRLDPAGRGINLSRALAEIEVATHAMLLLGTDAIGKAYEALLNGERFPSTLIRRNGLTRSNTIILDSGTRHETQIIEESVNLSDDTDDVRIITERLLDILQEGDTVCLSGVLPRGIPVDLFARVTAQVAEAGGKVVLAADGISLEIGVRANPDIVAIRSVELESFFNYPVRTLEDVIFSSRKLSERSDGSMVLVAQQELEFGLILDDHTGWVAEMPPTPEDSEGTTSGVHDAFLAGFLAHYRQSDDMPRALQVAMAAATYTRRRPGNEFATSDELDALIEQVEVRELPA